MRIQSHTQHQFSQVPKAEIQRSSFDRSFGYKTTFDAGYLIPIFVDEVLPGDTFNCKLSAFARLATPIKPIMDNIHIETFFFAVPYRLIWSNWQKFNGEQEFPEDSTDYVIPQTVAPAVTGHVANSIYDYMGLPVGVASITHSVLPLRAYNLIWNSWFRDQNLQNPASVPMAEGPDASTIFALKRRGKRHDYFTSCLPWPQKGPAVEIPLGATAPLTGTGNLTIPGMNTEFRTITDGAGVAHNLNSSASGPPYQVASDLTTGGDVLAWNPDQLLPFSDVAAGLTADLSLATAATINTLRQAFQVQRMYERDARGGTRYTEIIKSHFGVTSPDARLQRPEYLGGGSSYVNINPIAQTGQTATTPQGNLSAIGTAQFNGHGFSKSFTEHCIVIGLLCARADLTYQQGLNRMWSRSTRFDFYWPALSHIGEQAVLQKEIYSTGDPFIDDEVFGYQERFAEYRYKPSMITGEFRSSFAQSLDIWHLAQDFTEPPVLEDEFIQENPPIDRIIAVPSEPHFLFDSYFKLQCARPMPIYGVPGLIDHF